MADPFVGYDRWLEQPHQDALAEQDAFLDWCFDEGIHPEDDGAWDEDSAWDKWQQHLEEERL